MTELLYLGNQLSRQGLNPTSVEVLGDRLCRDFDCIRGSDKKNPMLRLLHMWLLVVKNRHARYLLIDTYSTQAFWFAITAAWLARMVKLPYIPILHGGDLPERKKKSPRILFNYLKKAIHVVCPSRFLQSEIGAFCERDYELIPNFIDLKNYPFQPKSKIQGIRLLWVRSFHEIYNPSLAIDVLHLLLQKGMDARLAMVGPDKDGSLQRTREYTREKGVSDKVQFTGGLSKKEWINFSKEYNFFINTTDVDNTPVSVMEAMALGFPVISTNVGGLPFLIESEEDGLLVNPGKAEEFADQIIRLRNNPKLFEALSTNARQKAENWDWPRVREKWLKLLNTDPR